MPAERYVGLDVHKRHVVVAAVDVQQNVVMCSQKIPVERFETWAQEPLCAADRVALETTANAWEFYDQLTPLVVEVFVANRYQLKVISASARKTDRHDALVLAKLLAAHLLPAVWVPPHSVRELRAVTTHLAELFSERSACKNRLHGLLHRNN